MKIAVLGMGRMGQAVASRLLEQGHELMLWNRTFGKGSDLAARGGVEVRSVEEAISNVELAVTSLASDDAVRAVAFDPGGIQDALPGDAVYVDVSTISRTLSDELDRAFRRFVAMPILGSPSATAAGKATYLRGGIGSAADVVDRLFPGLSGSVIRYDRPPLASTAKLAANLLLLDAVAALAESFAVGRAGGLSEEQLRELLGESPLVAPGIRNRFEGVLGGRQESWWTAAMGAKDVGLAIEVAHSDGIDLVATAAVRELYLRAASRWEADDITAVGRLYRR